MQTTFMLEINFGGAAITMKSCPVGPGTVTETCYTCDPNVQYELRVFCMYDKVIAFDKSSGSVRAEY